ncbi:MAG: hypothetical protein NC218_02440 [Acetobacter sp.]|nr:hypothetical protein [Acetobacter sp.]
MSSYSDREIIEKIFESENSRKSGVCKKFSSTESYFHDAGLFLDDTEDIDFNAYFGKLKNYQKAVATKYPVATLFLKFEEGTKFNDIYDDVVEALRKLIDENDLDKDFTVIAETDRKNQIINESAQKLYSDATPIDSKFYDKQRIKQAINDIILNAIDAIKKQNEFGIYDISTVADDKYEIRVAKFDSKEMTDRKAIQKLYDDFARTCVKHLEEQVKQLHFDEADKDFELAIKDELGRTTPIYVYYDGAFFYVTKRNAASANQLGERVSIASQARELKNILGLDAGALDVAAISIIPFATDFKEMAQVIHQREAFGPEPSRSQKIIVIQAIAYSEQNVPLKIEEYAQKIYEAYQDGDLVKSLLIFFLGSYSDGETLHYCCIGGMAACSKTPIIQPLAMDSKLVNGAQSDFIDEMKQLFKYDDDISVAGAHALNYLFNGNYSQYARSVISATKYNPNDEALLIAVTDSENAFNFQFPPKQAMEIRKKISQFFKLTAVSSAPVWYVISYVTPGGYRGTIVDFGSIYSLV